MNLTWGTISTTMTFLYYYFLCHDKFTNKFLESTNGRHSGDLLFDEKPQGCCGTKSDETFWHQKIHWVLHNLGIVYAIAVTSLYWGLLYDPDTVDQLGYDVTGGTNLVTHGINGLVALIDLFVCGIPFHLLHVIYPTAFAGTYAAFTGIYHSVNGTNVRGNPYIYSIIDYNNDPGSSTGVLLSVVFLFVPFLYVIIYCLFLVRETLIYFVRKLCCKTPGYQEQTFEM